MSGFPILDLVVGIIFVYFLLSIITSSAVEMILTGFRARAALLEEWLYTIFNKPIVQPDGTKVSLGQAIMDHCSVTALSHARQSTSYIDAKNFTSALLEKITFDPNNPKVIAKNINEFILAIDKSKVLSTEFQRVLLMYANDAKDTYRALSEKTTGEIDLFRGKIENWFDSSMQRITGTLKKRYSRPATFIVGIIVTVFLNADSISLAKYLYSNSEARTKIAMQAYDAVNDSALIKQVQQINTNTDTLSAAAISLQDFKNNMVKKIKDI
ncbi:MAG: hypothetical protein M3Z56_05435, partial [Bacteroidota bacterium]|nr:hypothetical protein [Bacteroidota bacterium]